MLFNSVEFLLFFPVVAALHWLLPHRFRWLLLLLASYIFYMAWEPVYAVLILLSTVVDYTVALRMPAAKGARRRALLATSVTVNIGLLASFKYYDMITSTVAASLAVVGIEWAPAASTLLLPVGISFYTFQTLSYSIDVYKGRIEPERHLGKFALFVSFFPQLVAGPIERAGKLLPQIIEVRTWDTDRAIEGMRQALWGMFKKVAIADHLAVLVAAVYLAPREFAGPAIILATFAFAYQVYCDFSGYSDIAIGTAKVLGIELSLNFDQPTLARSVAEFWTHWHITLINWLRDYVYIPMGGGRRAPSRVIFNVLFAFGLSGLWHGAAWHYVLWGLVNGFYIVVGRATADLRDSIAERTGFAKLKRTRMLWQWVSTIAIVYGSFILFRAESVPHALYMYSRLLEGWGEIDFMSPFILAKHAKINPLILGMMLLMIPMVDLVEWVRRHPERIAHWPWWTTWIGDWAMIFGILVLGRFTAQQFVYFQF